MLNRRSLLASSAASLPLFTAWPALAQARKDSVTLAMTLEPLDWTPRPGLLRRLPKSCSTTSSRR